MPPQRPKGPVVAKPVVAKIEQDKLVVTQANTPAEAGCTMSVPA